MHADKLGVLGNGGLPIQSRSDIGKRANADHFDPLGGFSDGSTDRTYAIEEDLPRELVEVIVTQPGLMGPSVVVERYTDPDWNIGAAGKVKYFGHQACSIQGIAGGGRD